MKTIQPVDILSIFNDTKKNIELDSIRLASKAELLDSIISYFVENKLIVTKEVEIEDVVDDKKTK